MEREQDRVRKIIENMAMGRETGQKLVYDRFNKMVRPVNRNHDPDWGTMITPKDATLYCVRSSIHD